MFPISDWHHLPDMECWWDSVRYHYCRLHDLLRGFPHFHCLWEADFLSMRVAVPIWYYHQDDENNFEKNYSPNDRDGYFDRCIYSVPIFNLCNWSWGWLIPAVIGIVCFSLAMLPSTYYQYYQVPMGVIGKVYANSMLVLTNSQMVLFSEKAQLTIISEARFAMALANNKDSAIETHREGISVYSEENMGPRRVQRVRSCKYFKLRSVRF